MNATGHSGATYTTLDEAPVIGGQALLYKARCLDDGRVVALKVAATPGDGPTARGLERLRSWAAHPVAGPRVVPAWDHGEWDGRPFVVMEWLPQTLVARAAGRDLPGRLTLARELVDALARVHAVGFVHGDLKPSNVLYSDDGCGPFFADIVVEAGLYSPGWAPPEQVAGGQPSAASDRYAVATITWLLVAGTPPCSTPIGPEDRATFDRAAPGLSPLRMALEPLLEPTARRRARSLDRLQAALDGALGRPVRPAPVRGAAALALLLPAALAVGLLQPRPAAHEARAPCPAGYAPVALGCERPGGERIVAIPGGQVPLGRGATDAALAPDSPSRTATLTRPFWADATESSQATFGATLGGYPQAGRSWTSEGVVLRCDVAAGISLVGPDLPAVCVSWRDAVTYANARSRRDGLTPAYTIGDEVEWARDADGWRLPTEAEWERLARGGAELPWAGAPAPDQLCGWANLRDLSAREKWGHEVPCDDGSPALSRVGRYAPNAWGVYDALGNALEWAWDRYGEGDVAAPGPDPAGPSTGPARLQKGGSWNHVARGVAARYAAPEWGYTNETGVRLVRYATSTVSTGPSSTKTKP